MKLNIYILTFYWSNKCITVSTKIYSFRHW